jgi:hypothetical protein
MCARAGLAVPPEHQAHLQDDRAAPGAHGEDGRVPHPPGAFAVPLPAMAALPPPLGSSQRYSLQFFVRDHLLVLLPWLRMTLMHCTEVRQDGGSWLRAQSTRVHSTCGTRSARCPLPATLISTRYAGCLAPPRAESPSCRRCNAWPPRPSESTMASRSAAWLTRAATAHHMPASLHAGAVPL